MNVAEILTYPQRNYYLKLQLLFQYLAQADRLTSMGMLAASDQLNSDRLSRYSSVGELALDVGGVALGYLRVHGFS